jgi:putrescine aminotransferase
LGSGKKMREIDGCAADSLSGTVEDYKNHLNPSLARLLKFSGYYAQECVGEGVYVYDEKGNKYIDCAGGYGVFILGHRHPAVVAAVKEQLDLMPLSSKVFFNPLQARLARELAARCHGELSYCFFCNSGAEAVEGAIKLARFCTGRTTIISASDSFHGKTLGALSVSGREIYKAPFEPLLPGTVQVPFNDVEAMKNAINKDTAAVILEPIQGEGGINVPDPAYISDVHRLCKEHGALFIADEIQAGMGRTGTFFAVEQWNVWPDIITLAKGLGGGVMPIGAILGTREVWKVFQRNPLIHTSTFGGNQLACRAALATIEVIDKEGLLGKAREVGAYFISLLQEVRDDYPDIIGEIRGRGLMIGVELKEERFGGSVIFEMAKGRVTGVYTLNNQKVIRFEPPLIISHEQVSEAVGIFRNAIKKTRDTFFK